jgi:cytochrome c biogenesis protein CcmG/thiol:disulfide interchange protein DsbE
MVDSVIGSKRLSVILLILLLVSFFSGCIELNGNGGGNDGTSINGEDFLFTTLEGTHYQLSDFRGKVVILDLMATWCQPCLYQMVELYKVYENYSRSELEIISLDMDPSESAELLTEYREYFEVEVGLELAWLFGMDDGSVWEKYKNGGGIPTICIFNQSGNLTLYHKGLVTFSEIPQGLPEDNPLLKVIIDGLLG